MASTRRETFHLFNCDKLCDLREVEVLLKSVEKKVPFKISSIKRHPFSREEIAKMVDKTIPNLKAMDYAVFIVHAGEACLSFNEGAAYGKIYEALKKRTGSGEKVFVVIAGDKNYKDKNEEERCFLSRWAKDTISLQFRTEFVDGRKSFIFSWNQKHRPVHEEALLHYFDPSKEGQKFVYQPEPEPEPVPQTEEPTVAPSPHSDIHQEEPETSVQEPSDEEVAMVSPADEGDGGRETSNEINESDIRVSSESSEDSTSWGNLKLHTHLRYGKISYDSKDVKTWDRSWRPPKKYIEHLEKEWKSTPDAHLRMFYDENSKKCNVKVEAVYTVWDYCSIS